MDARFVTEVAVIVPAHDEEKMIGAALDAIAVAVRRASTEVSVACRVIVVLDSCTDATAAIVAARPDLEALCLEVLDIQRRNVGAARARGVASAIEMNRVGVGRLWIANTDADSVVPPNWITHQVQLARAGTELMVGSVFPVGDELDPAQFRAWLRRETADPDVLHVHGSNLGLRADTYLAVGGFDPHPEHEDVMLVERIIGSGARVTATDACRVATSARRHGRTPGGFAAHLRDNY